MNEELIARLREQADLRELFASDIGARIEMNYDLLANDAEKLLETVLDLAEDPRGAELLCILFGITDIETFFEEFAELVVEHDLESEEE